VEEDVVGREFSRRPDMTAPATVAASARRQGKAPEDEQARQAPVAADVAAREVGGTPDPEAQAAALVETSGGRLARTGGLLLRWQREFGNRHVQQVVQHALRAGRPAPVSGSSPTLGPAEDRYEQQADQLARRVAGGAPSRRAAGDATAGRGLPAPAVQDERGGVDGRVRQAIQGARGGGQPLPQQVRDQVEPVVGADLGRVRVHTDARADQLARALGARAFTTEGEVFLRRGEYRPDSPAGQRLLAHELAHVAQQAGGTVDADGGSGVSPGAAGAGVIQRITIRRNDRDYDTEDQAQLTALKKTVVTMSRDEAQAMLSDIESKLTVADPPATPAVVSLQKLLNMKAGNPVQREKKQEVVVQPPQKQERVVQPPQKQELVVQPPGPVVSPQSQDPAQGADIRREGEELTNLAAPLIDVLNGGSQEILLSYRKKAYELGSRLEGWLDRFSAMQPSERQAFDALSRNIEQAKGTLTALTSFSKSTREAESKRLETKRAERRGTMTAEIPGRQEEVTAGRVLVNQYVDYDAKLVFKLEGEGNDGYAELLVKWIFTSAIEQAEAVRSPSEPWVADLLAHLRARRQANDRLLVTVVGVMGLAPGAEGEGSEFQIIVRVRLANAADKSPLEILVGDDAQATKIRDDLVTGTASTFLHEASHSLQEKVYGNASYPWPKFKGTESTTGGFTGFERAQLPWDVKEALDEFVKGGENGQAAADPADPAWSRINSSLHESAYYVENKRTRTTTKDIRAKELVSHLMELAYAWRAKPKGQGFRDVFPSGADLLDTVISKQQ
jgi:hypothetical protein